MKLTFGQLKNKHSGQKCIVCAHGRSLNLYRDKLPELKRAGYVMFSTNEWYHFYDAIPKYWILANSENTIYNMHGMMNTYPESIIIYADSVDLTDRDFVDKHLRLDYLPYDQRHPNGHPCCGECCKHAIPGRLTIQQELYEYAKVLPTYEGGGSGITHAIAIAIIMGFKEIYFIGIDLDWDKGYAQNRINQEPTESAKNEVDYVRDMTVNDLKLLRSSADNVGCKIYNLNPNSIFDCVGKASL